MKKKKMGFGFVVLTTALVLAQAAAAFAQGRASRGVAVERSSRGSAAQAPEAAPSEQRGTVNLNTATADELQRLPGIGPSKAQAILSTRQRMGRFARVEDVLRVRGIGRATLRRLHPMLSIEGPTTLSAPPAHARSGRTRTATAQE